MALYLMPLTMFKFHHEAEALILQGPVSAIKLVKAQDILYCYTKRMFCVGHHTRPV